MHFGRWGEFQKYFKKTESAGSARLHWLKSRSAFKNAWRVPCVEHRRYLFTNVGTGVPVPIKKKDNKFETDMSHQDLHGRPDRERAKQIQRDGLCAARSGTLDQIMQFVLPNFITPVPTKATVRAWFDAAGISRFKINPAATRGGGRVFYNISAVERLLQQLTLQHRPRVPSRNKTVTGARLAR